MENTAINSPNMGMNFSGYEHKEQLASLFHVWLDCDTLLKLGAVEVSTLVALT